MVYNNIQKKFILNFINYQLKFKVLIQKKKLAINKLNQIYKIIFASKEIFFMIHHAILRWLIKKI